MSKDEDIHKVRMFKINHFGNSIGVLNLPPSPWLSIALSPSVRRRGHILFAKALVFFWWEGSMFLWPIKYQLFSFQGMGWA